VVVGQRERDQATVSSLHTIATRSWTPPTGHARDAVLDELREIASGRTDLMIEAAGVLLGTRPADEHDPRHRQRTAGAEILLDAAGVPKGDQVEAVRPWVPIGADRWYRWRRPPKTGSIA
jgi:hypothetical protein